MTELDLFVPATGLAGLLSVAADFAAAALLAGAGGGPAAGLAIVAAVVVARFSKALEGMEHGWEAQLYSSQSYRSG